MYLDSCIIVKLLAPESDSEVIQARLQEEFLSTSELAWAEGAAALLSKERAGMLTAVPLRTFDALHVAACDLSQDFPLCTTNRRMREAAGLLGVPVFPEEASA